MTGEGLKCLCGKVSLAKKTAQTKANFYHNKGRSRYMEIYQCNDSDWWHLTNRDRSRNEEWKKKRKMR